MKPNSDNRLKAEWDASFSDGCLPDGHLQRFEQLLDKQSACRKKTIARKIGIAATIAAASLIGIIWVWKPDVQTNRFSSLPQEIVEVCNYYNSQLYVEKEKIKDLLPRIAPTDRKVILHTFHQMKQDEAAILTDINGPICNDQRIAYLVQCYSSQLASLKGVYTQLKTINN